MNTSQNICVRGLLAASLLCFPAIAGDHYVNPGRSGAFPTIQAAHDAAQPGDRIFVEVHLPAAGETVITKSVVIQSIDNRLRRLPYVGNATQPGRFLIQSLTPGLPLVLRNLAFEFFRQPGASKATVGIRSGNTSNRDLYMEGCSVDTGAIKPPLPMLFVDIHMNRVWIRNLRMIAYDTADVDGCAPVSERGGTDGVRIFCRNLIVESAEIRAGSGAFVRYSTCGSGSQAPLGGPGGRAVYAVNDASVFVDCHLSDGLGGDVQTGPWSVTPVPGLRTESMYVDPTGVFDAYNSTTEPARDGLVLPAPDPVRASKVQMSHPEAPLRLIGEARVGGTLVFEVVLAPIQVCLVMVGFDWTFTPTPMGVLWVHPLTIAFVLPFGSSGSIPLNVPADPALVGLSIVSQSVRVPQFTLGNPSGFMVRL